MRLTRFYAALTLVGVVAALLVLALVTPILATREDFSVYNGDWNGASQMGRALHGSGAFNPLLSVERDDERLQVVPVSLGARQVDPATTSVLVVGPRAPFTDDERAFLRTFVAAGGLLVVADDFGTGNEALEAAGAATRIRAERALDFAFAKRPEFTIGVDFAPHPLTEGVGRALLNYPAALALGPEAMPLANTSEAAWLDLDEDGLRGPTEPGGPFAYLAVEHVGAGQVVVLADPSVLINGMRPFADNARLADKLVAYVTASRATVLVDESHRGGADPLGVALSVSSRLPPVARATLVLFVAGLAAIALLPATAGVGARVRGRLARLLAAEDEPAPRRDLVARARERHPDWDEMTLRRILDGWRTPREP